MSLWEQNKRVWASKTARTARIANGKHGDIMFSDDRGENYKPMATADYDVTERAEAKAHEVEVVRGSTATMTAEQIRAAASMPDPYEEGGQ